MYTIGLNSTISASDSSVTISLYALVGIIVGSAVFLVILIVVVYYFAIKLPNKQSRKVEDGSSASFKVFTIV